MIDPTLSARFRRIGLLTLFAVYLVILAGGIVRASGAGMGCPDWPKCFGQWIPPTAESQLPPNYHETYAQRGYADTRFNAQKTWTEYGNRLIGATTGILVLLTLLASRHFRQSDPAVFQVSLAVFLAIGFQGWLGSAVVASNLRPWMITAHMLMAFLIVCLLLYAIARSQKEQLADIDATRLPPRFKTVLLAAMAMTLLQMAMGTQIRQVMDPLIFENLVHGDGGDRSLWREHFPLIFLVHRSFSSLILFTNGWLVWQVFKHVRRDNLLFHFGMVLGGLILTAIATGVSLDRLGFPAVAQPVHLLMANLIFGTQFFLLLVYRYAETAGNAPTLKEPLLKSPRPVGRGLG
ncbi:MAG: COX15/CtaA family protein [Candidatus Methylumidiphilus sp.]